MARIAGVDLPRDKRVEVGLTYIYGIGRPTSNKILKELNINPDTRVKDLTENEVNALRNIKRLIEIGSYRGLRHRRGLPVRGQKTKTNARTRKGPKKTVGRKSK